MKAWRNITLGALFAVAAVQVAGCGSNGASRDASAPAPGRMSAASAREFLASHPDALLLDVRNPDEWNDDVGHIEGARLIPLPELSGRIGEIQAWKAKPVVVVCRVGGRSRHAAEVLANAGFEQVYNLEGGMVAWRRMER